MQFVFLVLLVVGIGREIFIEKTLPVREKAVPLQPGKSYTASSLPIPQALTGARVTRL